MFPTLPPSSPPAPSAAHWDTFQPLMPRPREAAQQIIAVSAVPPARTRPRPRADPSPGVSQPAADCAAPYLPCRSSGPAAALPSASRARRQLGSAPSAPGVPGQRRERLAGEMETETRQGLRQREEEREGFPITGSPELGNSDSCGEKA